MKNDEYKITRTFSVKIKLWKCFKDKLADERKGVSEVISLLIEQWLNGKIN